MVAAIWRALERRSAPIAAIAAIGTAIVGLIWGTYVAGGPDSYCHINQAELFVQGRVHDPQPIVEDAPWPDRVNTAVPVGHVAAPRGTIAAVPMCPPGYAASLAFARLIGGRAAMFWVVPALRRARRVVHVPDRPARRRGGCRPAGRDPPCDQSQPSSINSCNRCRTCRPLECGRQRWSWRSTRRARAERGSLERSAAPRCSCARTSRRWGW